MSPSQDGGSDKQPWPFPLNILKEEWHEVKRAKTSFILCAIVFLLVGGSVVYFLFASFIVPGKDATIESLQSKGGDGIHYSKLIWAGPTNSVSVTNQYLMFQAASDCAITEFSNPSDEHVGFAVLAISNTSPKTITLYTAAPSARLLGNSSAALKIPSGRIGILSVNCFGRSLCHYATIVD